MLSAQQLPDFLATPEALCRYCRARSWQLEPTLKMLRDHLQWRKDIDLDREYDAWTREQSDKLQCVKVCPAMLMRAGKHGPNSTTARTTTAGLLARTCCGVVRCAVCAARYVAKG